MVCVGIFADIHKVSPYRLWCSYRISLGRLHIVMKRTKKERELKLRISFLSRIAKHAKCS